MRKNMSTVMRMKEGGRTKKKGEGGRRKTKRKEKPRRANRKPTIGMVVFVFGDRYDIDVAAVARTSRSFLQAVQRCSAAVPVRAVPTPSMTLTRDLPW